MLWSALGNQVELARLCGTADNGRIQRHLGQLGGAYGALLLGSSVLKLLGEPGRIQRFDRRADSQRGRMFALDSCPLCLGKCTQDPRTISTLGWREFQCCLAAQESIRVSRKAKVSENRRYETKVP
jgi:hypothetical protein